METVIHLQSD